MHTVLLSDATTTTRLLGVLRKRETKRCTRSFFPWFLLVVENDDKFILSIPSFYCPGEPILYCCYVDALKKNTAFGVIHLHDGERSESFVLYVVRLWNTHVYVYCTVYKSIRDCFYSTTAMA